MCELVRQYLPAGHDRRRRPHRQHARPGTSGSTPTTSSAAKGVRWFRRFLGEDDEPARPASADHRRASARGAWASRPGEAAATWPPRSSRRSAARWAATSAPPRPCSAARASSSTSTRPATNCSTSCASSKRAMQVRSFFIMDENFLLHRERALRLLELMEQHDKAWALYVFSSGQRAAVLHDRATRRPGRLLGLDGPGRREQPVRASSRGIDTRELVRQLQSHGIRVLGSTIIGLEEHTPENIDEVDRLCRAPRHRLPPVHALHADPRHAACTPSSRPRGG